MRIRRSKGVLSMEKGSKASKDQDRRKLSQKEEVAKTEPSGSGLRVARA
jgi:hypothetical protein